MGVECVESCVDISPNLIPPRSEVIAMHQHHCSSSNRWSPSSLGSCPFTPSPAVVPQQPGLLLPTHADAWLGLLRTSMVTPAILCCLPQHRSPVSGLCVPPSSLSCIMCTCLAASTCQPATHILRHRSQSVKIPAQAGGQAQ